MHVTHVVKFCADGENYLTITFTNVWRTLLDVDGNVIPWHAWELGGSIAQNGPLRGCLLFKELLYTKVDDALSWKSQ